MSESTPRPYKTAAYALGGGGPFAIGYEMGIIEAFQQKGIDVRHAEMLGTSGGSWAASLTATGKTFDDIKDVQQVKIPDIKPGLIKSLAHDVLGEETAPNVSAMVVKILGLRAMKLSGKDHLLSDIVAASSSVPGIFYPHRIRGNHYWDGGVRSVVSADVAPRADKMIAIAALAQHFMPPVGGALEALLYREMGIWDRKHGGESILIRPNRAISSLIKNPKDLFDFAIAKDVYWMAQEQGSQIFETNKRFLGELALRDCA